MTKKDRHVPFAERIADATSGARVTRDTDRVHNPGRHVDFDVPIDATAFDDQRTTSLSDATRLAHSTNVITTTAGPGRWVNIARNDPDGRVDMVWMADAYVEPDARAR